MRALNLAERPFRNERLPAALFMAASLVLLAVTAWHGMVIRDLLPARTTERHQEVAALEAEAARLAAEARTLKTEAPPAATLAQWNLVKDLVDRRAFSWTGLFARLEELIPEGVRLKSVSPSVARGQLAIDVQAAVRSREAGWEFVRVLEDGGDFYDVYPSRESGNEFTYRIRYRPRKAGAVIGPPVPSPAPSAESAIADPAAGVTEARQ
jgi:Tfp pilus assembly protein PilN